MKMKTAALFILLVGLTAGHLCAQDTYKNNVRFKFMKINRDADSNRYAGFTTDLFSPDQVTSADYAEDDNGLSVTDEAVVNPLISLIVTAGYYGQFRTNIVLDDQSNFQLNENFYFIYGGIRLGKTFFKRVDVFGILGYGYYRDRIRIVGPESVDLPDPILLKTVNHDGFEPALEFGLIYWINEQLGITAGYEKNKFMDVNQTSTQFGLSLHY